MGRPFSQKEKIKINKHLRENGLFMMPEIKVSKRNEFAYRKKLMNHYKGMVDDVNNQILPILKAFVSDSAYTKDVDFFSIIKSRISDISDQFVVGGNRFAEMTAQDMVDKELGYYNNKFMKAIPNSFGLDMSGVLSSPNLKNILSIKMEENVDLIKSVPNNYLSKVKALVARNLTTGISENGGLQAEVYKLLNYEIIKSGKNVAYYARRIARDQISKTNAAINQQRQEQLGVDSYVWQDSGDRRVRATHEANNGKVFRWDSPPKNGTGHPGHDIQCRCTARGLVQFKFA